MFDAMPEATVLFSVTAVVVVALVVWVVVVLARAKQPWARAASPGPIGPGLEADPGVDPAAVETVPATSPSPQAPVLDADSTARATPVALGNRPKDS